MLYNLSTNPRHRSLNKVPVLIVPHCLNFIFVCSRLIAILRHFAHDGVYATYAQRTAGGGSLNLIEYVCDELEIPHGHITGAWDIAHLMEVKKVQNQKPLFCYVKV